MGKEQEQMSSLKEQIATGLRVFWEKVRSHFIIPIYSIFGMLGWEAVCGQPG